MSWSDEDNDWDAPKAGGEAVTDKWDGEDEDDENLLGDDWDADPEEKKATTTTAAKPVVKKLTKRQMLKKKEEEEREAARKKAELRKAGGGGQTEEDRAAIRKAIDDANSALCDDLFGGEEAPEGGEFKSQQLEDDNVDMVTTAADIAALKNLKIKQEEPLEDVKLATMDDYKKFGEKVAGIATKDGKSTVNAKFLVAFVNAVVSGSIEKGKLKLDDCNTIKKSLNVICTKKQKEESNKKKKGGTKKAQLTMSRDAFDDGDYYDDGADDGFM